MSRRLPLVVLASTGLVALSLGCAVPAVAAAPAPSPSVSVSSTPAYPEPVVETNRIVGSTHGESFISGQLFLTGAKPDTAFHAVNETTGDETEPFTEIGASGHFGFSLVVKPGVVNDFRIEFFEDDDKPVRVMHVEVDDTRPDFAAPAVSTAVENGRLVITGTGTAPGTGYGEVGETFLVVRDAQGHQLARQLMSSATASVVLPATTDETRYSVSMFNQRLEGPASDVIANEGVGTAVPAAPDVDVTESGSRMVAEITGEPGAIATLRDVADDVMAVRVIGVGGKALIALPSRVSGTKIVATQTRGRLVSDAVSVPLPN